LWKTFKEDYDIDIYDKKYENELGRLRYNCEKAKRTLSNEETTDIFIEELLEGKGIIINNFNRNKFEEMSKNILDKIDNVINEALKSGKIKEEKINEVILIGSPTKMPMIRKKLQEKFSQSKINNYIVPDETVAMELQLLVLN